jgi:hypothetical protein
MKKKKEDLNPALSISSKIVACITDSNIDLSTPIYQIIEGVASVLIFYANQYKKLVEPDHDSKDAIEKFVLSGLVNSSQGVETKGTDSLLDSLLHFDRYITLPNDEAAENED